MVEIETFLRHPDGRFSPVGSCQTPPGDPDYIEGAIRLVIDGMEILGVEEWDYVDQFWCYIAHMVAQLASESYAETYLPDQPIKLSFRRVNSNILVVLKDDEETKKASTPAVEFLAAVRSAGLSFFDKMSQLSPNSYEDARAELAS
ncbi:hypothetical protein ACFY2W_04060 [Streptomyces sp. NPDC001262]|uniref:hypothetical protein n=1 Tax=Streptomyces sp. NPDC001262 TaxID=3364552 RepID=UPI0036B4AF40